jgi:integrase
MDSVSDADIIRSREDPRFKQILLAKSLEQLLASLHRLQHASKGPGTAHHLRQGALIAVLLADRIRAIEDQLSSAKSPRLEPR